MHIVPEVVTRYVDIMCIYIYIVNSSLAYSFARDVRTRAFMRGFYLLYKSIMTKFEHWDTIVSTSNEWLQVEAVVDFQQGDKLYISEWWKNLSYPVRYVIPVGDNIHKKENGKLTISLQEINSLMAMVMWLAWANYNSEPTFDWIEVWQSIRDTYNGRTYTYMWQLDGEAVWQSEWYFCIIDDEDLKKMLWTKEDVCKRLFGLTPDEVNVLDD